MGLGLTLPFLPHRLGQAQDAGQAVTVCVDMASRDDVRQDAEVAKQADILERARNAGAGDAVWRKACDSASLENDRAPARRRQPGDQVEESRLACTVRANQPKNFAS